MNAASNTDNTDNTINTDNTLNINNTIDVSVLYEDNHIICAVKPRGILSQADDTGSPDMLTILKRYIKRKYGKPGDVYLGLVHRLDRPVGGVMAFARTSKAAGRLSAQIRDRTIKKGYYGVVCGAPDKPSGMLEHKIVKDSATNRVRVSHAGPPEPEELESNSKSKSKSKENAIYEKERAALEKDRAVLEYETLAAAPGGNRDAGEMSLVRVKLQSGRPHQIRAQFAFIGHPIVGDRKYGGGREGGRGRADESDKYGDRRGDEGGKYGGGRRGEREDEDAVRGDVGGKKPDWPALWAFSLEFEHPVGGAPIRIEALPPDEFPWNLFDKKLYK